MVTLKVMDLHHFEHNDNINRAVLQASEQRFYGCAPELVICGAAAFSLSALIHISRFLV